MTVAKANPTKATRFGLISLTSCPEAALRSVRSCSTMWHQTMLLDDGDEARVAKWQQRTIPQLAEKCREPQTTDADGRQERRPVQAETIGMKRRRDKPEKLHQVHQRDRAGNRAERRGFAFDLSRQEQNERQGELQYDQSDSDAAPAAAHTMEIPGNFVLKVLHPNKQELRKRHVGPQHDEGQQQITQILKHPRRDDAR